MKSIIGFVRALASTMNIQEKSLNKDYIITPKEIVDTEEEKKLSQGLKKFYYGKSYVFALNQYNADRKAKNLGLI